MDIQYRNNRDGRQLTRWSAHQGRFKRFENGSKHQRVEVSHLRGDQVLLGPFWKDRIGKSSLSHWLHEYSHQGAAVHLCEVWQNQIC